MQASNSDETGPDRPSHWAAAAWQVREDRKFYVPDVMSNRSYEDDATCADEHARHLRRAQGRLEDVLNLAGVLRASIGD